MKQTGEKAQKYIKSLKNKEKKRYATVYYQALLKGEGNSLSIDTSLGFMGRQAVEMNLNKIEQSFWND